MNAISQALNFKYTIAPPSDGGLWGEMVSPGVFTGVVGELQKEFADVIWANLFIIPDRFQYIDYLDPYATDYVCYMVYILFVDFIHSYIEDTTHRAYSLKFTLQKRNSFQVRVPQPLPQWMALVIPFQTEVWLWFAASVVAVIAFSSLYTILDPTTIFRTKDAWLYACYMIFDESYSKFIEVK